MLSLVAFGAGVGLSTHTSGERFRDLRLDIQSLHGDCDLVIVGVMSSAVGGYLAGRLRTRWMGLHTNEVFFRDTAHGFLAWALATLIGATALVPTTAYLANGVMTRGLSRTGDAGEQPFRNLRRQALSHGVHPASATGTQTSGDAQRQPAPRQACQTALIRTGPRLCACGPPAFTTMATSVRATELTLRSLLPHAQGTNRWMPRSASISS